VSTLTVHVTQDRINRGRPSHPGECAIACAIRDKFPDAEILRVLHYEIQIDNRWFNPTARAIDFINRYDQHEPVAPTTFRFKERL
jgi:hypothetical protein